MRVVAIGCECLGDESLRLQFGAGLKSDRELTDPIEPSSETCPVYFHCSIEITRTISAAV